MDKSLLDWVSEQISQGAQSLEITAAVARAVAANRNLPLNGSEPALLNIGSLKAPDGVIYTADIIGSVYEQSLDASTRRHGGVHYTPFEVAKKLARMSLNGLPVGPVCDPSVGGGAFLLAAGEYFLELGESTSRIIEELLWGIDLDPGAIEVAKASLSIWGSVESWIPIGKHLVVSDSLKKGIGSFEDPPQEGFTAVIGNPPFQNQLQESTVRPLEETQELRKKWQVKAGPYADTASYFLLVALSFLGKKAKCLLIQPQSVLATVDAEPIRTKVKQEANLEGIWIGGPNIFEAGVNVCAPLISKGFSYEHVRIWTGTQIDELPNRLDDRDNWASAIAIAQGAPAINLEGNHLGEIASATAGFRDQFYGLAPHVTEYKSEMTDVAPLITVGMIDPLRNRWGSAQFRYAGKSWLKPVVDLRSLLKQDEELYEWVKDRLKPKVLLATQTKVIEVLPDPEGKLIPSTPVISIECASQDVWKIASALSSAAMSAHVFSKVAGSALSSNTIKLSAKQVNALPLPYDLQRWEQASYHAHQVFNSKAKDVDLIQKMSQQISLAYDCSDTLLEDWWAKRLPKWR
ncbi:MAG: hypothetical protein CL431_04585 [Acidimicrobiaceae bacterium]|nr:hypothetical protein [Acidimicrobiaceae bacterium]|tara:strand:- start:117466 stop:119190 length:1725 start_codon:yes stop_codon:yes gene_type:complete